jgi:tetratricopeptide (TPR) repeat protein
MAQPAINPKIEELRFRLKTDPKSRLFYQLAEELRRAGQFGESESVLRNGLLSYPTYLAAWVSLGRVLREQKNDGGAVEALNKALQLDPGNVVAARLLADAYAALGEKVEAIKKYKLVQALLPAADEELRAVIDQLDREIGPRPPVPATEAEAGEAVDAASAGPAEAEAEVEAAPVFEEAPQAAAASEAPEPQAFADEPPAAPEDSAPWEASPDALFGGAAGASPAGGAEVEDAPAFEEAPEAVEAPEASASEASAPEAAAAPPEEVLFEESPFDRTLPPFAEAARSLGEEMRVERETADVEPMSRAHDESPFEEPVEGFTAAAVEIEAPLGMQIVSAPLAADVPAFVDDELPTVDSTPVFDTTSAAAATETDDAANTITMADLYVRQGLLEDARHIYENILARDPGNAEVRGKLEAITPRVNPKVVALERWLAKVSKREVGRGL